MNFQNNNNLTYPQIVVLKSSHNNLGNKCQQKMLVRNFFRSGEKLLRSFNFWATEKVFVDEMNTN